MIPVRRIRYTGMADVDGAKINRLRGALAALGCRPYGPDVPLSANADTTRKSSMIRFEEGMVTISWGDGVIVVYAELIGTDTQRIKEAIERELAIINPTVVEDDGVLPG